jgi:hypothetical protein
MYDPHLHHADDLQDSWQHHEQSDDDQANEKHLPSLTLIEPSVAELGILFLEWLHYSLSKDYFAYSHYLHWPNNSQESADGHPRQTELPHKPLSWLSPPLYLIPGQNYQQLANNAHLRYTPYYLAPSQIKVNEHQVSTKNLWIQNHANLLHLHLKHLRP